MSGIIAVYGLVVSVLIAGGREYRIFCGKEYDRLMKLQSNQMITRCTRVSSISVQVWHAASQV